MDPRSYYFSQKFQGVFFDFDGVLVDSVGIKTRAYIELFASRGAEIAQKVADHHRRHGGMSRYEKIPYYYKHFLNEAIDEEKLDLLCREYSRMVFESVVRAPEIPGAETFLKSNHESTACFVVSATPHNEIVAIVKARGWSRYFRDIRGAPADKEKNLQLLLSKYSLSPADCIFFGDSESDYLAARKVGMPFLGIIRSTESPLLKCVPPVIWVDDFNSLLAETQTEQEQTGE